MTHQNQFTWGFMLENTLFVEFDQANHIIIENSYQQKKMKQSSHHIKSLSVVNSNNTASTTTVQDDANFHLYSQHYPYQKQQKRSRSQQQQHNTRRRHSQATIPLTKRSSSNNLYLSPSRLPDPSTSVSLTYPLTTSISTSTSTSTLSTSLSPSSSSTMVPFSPPMVLSNPNHLHDMTLASSYSSSAIENMSTSLLSNNNMPITDDNFTSLWNSSWLDSLYATSSTSSMQALLIPCRKTNFYFALFEQKYNQSEK
ncbi:hypothetical protein BCR42DRAFT_450735 [Absidia repens]|uniref:Uncharacterized protein n=1 Tax=Absidia repens TaxID=90262 RepID=A0A1X2IHZ2_9FUNG|nr:hypothetical protein BCR42DRAFT_450735 [Absidia repens]